MLSFSVYLDIFCVEKEVSRKPRYCVSQLPCAIIPCNEANGTHIMWTSRIGQDYYPAGVSPPPAVRRYRRLSGQQVPETGSAEGSHPRDDRSRDQLHLYHRSEQKEYKRALADARRAYSPDYAHHIDAANYLRREQNANKGTP